MLTNNDILNFVRLVLNKDQNSSYNPSEFNENLPIAQLRHFKKKVGIPEQYQPGQPILREVFENTQINTGDLSPFKTWLGKPGTTPLQIDVNGFAPIPTDFYYPSTLDYVLFDNSCPGVSQSIPIDVLTDAQWSARKNHPRKAPTYKYPVCNFQAGYIRFLPVNLQWVQFIYLRVPISPVYDYYIQPSGEYIYLPQGTTHMLLAGEEGSAGQTAGTVVVSQTVELEFNDTNKIDIAYTLLADKGVNLQEPIVTQYAEMLKNRGV